ncbi:hypothetical protein R3P38DRAFT_3451023 [Favolaschia claudopus]|uniref:Uncharacterized protein n=1 Tax=Favolaschia claudopus TaxID=2862362 RepID=A0AAV9ZL70_9AGAR
MHERGKKMGPTWTTFRQHRSRLSLQRPSVHLTPPHPTPAHPTPTPALRARSRRSHIALPAPHTAVNPGAYPRSSTSRLKRVACPLPGSPARGTVNSSCIINASDSVCKSARAPRPPPPQATIQSNPAASASRTTSPPRRSAALGPSTRDHRPQQADPHPHLRSYAPTTSTAMSPATPLALCRGHLAYKNASFFCTPQPQPRTSAVR